MKVAPLRKQTSFKDDEQKVCFCLKRDSQIRILSSRIVRSLYFDRFIIIAIILNSIVLTLADYQRVDSSGDLVKEDSWRNTILLESEVYFTAIFTLECILKVLSFGFYGPDSYTSDRWNWIDFTVVISGILSLIPGVPNLSVLRTFRVLRPIKILSTNKGN